MAQMSVLAVYVIYSRASSNDLSTEGRLKACFIRIKKRWKSPQPTSHHDAKERRVYTSETNNINTTNPLLAATSLFHFFYVTQGFLAVALSVAL